MLPARSHPVRPSRDALVLLLMFLLLAGMAWRADRARGVEAPTTIATCAVVDDEQARMDCLEHAIDVSLDSGRPIGGVLARVNEHARRDAAFSRRCHMVMHERGRAHEGVVTPGSIAHDGKDCAAGFLHGWLLEHLDEVDRSTVRAWCGPARTSLEHADCEHGMGHVIVRHLGGDLRAALAQCRTLGDAAFLHNCASGAYMENRFGGQARDDAAPTDYWREGDPWLPCRAATGTDLLDVCAAWAVRDVPTEQRRSWCGRLAARTGVDARACLVAAGSSAPMDRPARDACANSAACWFGRGFAWAVVGWDQDGVAEAAAGCNAGTGVLRDACARGVGFRRAASIADPLDVAAAVSCDELFAGSARAACHAGAADRDAPIAYA